MMTFEERQIAKRELAENLNWTRSDKWLSQALEYIEQQKYLAKEKDCEVSNIARGREQLLRKIRERLLSSSFLEDAHLCDEITVSLGDIFE